MSAGTISGLIVVALLFGVLAAFWGGFILMLLLGALHNSVYAPIPALGYWTCVLIALALSILRSAVFGVSRGK